MFTVGTEFFTQQACGKVKKILSRSPGRPGIYRTTRDLGQCEVVASRLKLTLSSLVFPWNVMGNKIQPPALNLDQCNRPDHAGSTLSPLPRFLLPGALALVHERVANPAPISTNHSEGVRDHLLSLLPCGIRREVRFQATNHLIAKRIHRTKKHIGSDSRERSLAPDLCGPVM